VEYAVVEPRSLHPTLKSKNVKKKNLGISEKKEKRKK
jgi:hypothetical protein